MQGRLVNKRRNTKLEELQDSSRFDKPDLEIRLCVPKRFRRSWELRKSLCSQSGVFVADLLAYWR